MRILLTVLLFLTLGTINVEDREDVKRDFWVFKSEIFNLQVQVPWNWKIQNSGKEGFMILPKKEITLTRSGASAIPYIEVYSTRESCTTRDTTFRPETIPPGKEIEYYERLNCNGKVAIAAVYWHLDPEREKTKAVLEEMLKSMVPLKKR